MTAAILNAIQTDENIIILIRGLLTYNLNNNVPTTMQLQNMCALLGISTS